jgi:two-component system response regulator
MTFSSIVLAKRSSIIHLNQGREEIMDIQNEVEILLVEDNPNDVELTLRALKKHNLANKIHVVKDGAEALDYIFASNAYAYRKIEDRPKVILLDLKLPKVSGLEVLSKIKSDERTKIIPVVVLTSSKEERDLVESYRLGANSYITKPVDFDKFVGSVSELGLYWLLLNQPPR